MTCVLVIAFRPRLRMYSSRVGELAPDPGCACMARVLATAPLADTDSMMSKRDVCPRGSMVRTQVHLEEELESLRRLAARAGRRQSSLIRETIDRFVGELPIDDDWRVALDETAGAWGDRDDLDDLLAEGRRSAEGRLRRLWG